MTREHRLHEMLNATCQAAHRLWLAAERDDAAELEQARDCVLDRLEDFENEALASRQKLLPAWLTERMCGDTWHFGLLLTTGHVLYIETLVDVTQAADGSVWLDVRLAEACDINVARATNAGWPKTIGRPTTRDMCSVALAHVVCAVELADT